MVVSSTTAKIVQSQKQRLRQENSEKQTGGGSEPFQNFISGLIRANITEGFEFAEHSTCSKIGDHKSAEATLGDAQQPHQNKIQQNSNSTMDSTQEPKRGNLVSTASQTDVIKIRISTEGMSEQKRKDQEAKWKLLQQQIGSQIGSNAINLNVGLTLNSQQQSIINNDDRDSSDPFSPPPPQELAIDFVGSSGTTPVPKVSLNEAARTETYYTTDRFGKRRKRKFVPAERRRSRVEKAGEGVFKYCGFEFTQQGDNYHCNTCSSKYNKLEGIKGHIRREHLDGEYQCPKCKKYCINQTAVRKHRCANRQEEEKSLPPRTMELEPGKFVLNGCSFEKLENGAGYKCGTCEKIKPLKRQMVDHIKLYHAGICHQCDICKRKFLYKTTLLEHLPSHSEIPTFLCSQCGRMFKTKKNLQTHISFNHTKTRTRNRGPPPICKICNNMTFNSHWAYYNHKKKIHSLDQPISEVNEAMEECEDNEAEQYNEQGEEEFEEDYDNESENEGEQEYDEEDVDDDESGVE